ncbi:MAG: hypothetical protein IKP60_07530 [Treponema sp.]|nr:hypothetical protein [Treponema sp.]
MLFSEIHKVLDESNENRNYSVERMLIVLEQRRITRSFPAAKMTDDMRRTSAYGQMKSVRESIKWQSIIRQDFTVKVL